MDKNKLLYWLDRYNKEEDRYSSDLEKKLGYKVRINKKLTKEDLRKIIEWKFRGRLIGRRARTLNLIEETEDSEIQAIITRALDCNTDEVRLKKLMDIGGIGIALASVILTFYNPNEYCVFDIHVYDELFHTNSKTRPKDLFSNINYYLQILEKVRHLAKENGLSVREVEKALFKKNLEEGKSEP